LVTLKKVRTTVTWKEQFVNWPQASLAVQVTVVTPIGKKLPLGGTQLTLTGAQPPEAVLLNKTMAPLGVLAGTVMLVEQARLIGGLLGGLTVMVKLQLVLPPQLSLAVQVTVVVPTGKVLPLGGLQVTVGGGLHPPLAELVKNTVAPPGPVALTVRLDEQLRVSRG
jgi:hypothetical protein